MTGGFLRDWLLHLIWHNEMPSDLVLVRHGESEGNKTKNEQEWFNHPEFAKRHSSDWRLTDKGRWQRNEAGLWIRQNILPVIPGKKFYRHYTSNYVRAMETAGGLGLNAEWFVHFFLRERDWGWLDVMSKEQRQKLFPRELEWMKIGGFLTAPPNGESLADLCIRGYLMNNTLGRECARRPVIMVNHGEFMWGERVLLERIPLDRYRLLDESKDPKDRIHNCQILWYTRRDPVSGKLAKYFKWMKSVCPWDLSLSHNEWREIERPRFSDEELLARAEAIPQIVS